MFSFVVSAYFYWNLRSEAKERRKRNIKWYMAPYHPHWEYLAWFLRDYHEQLVQILVQDTRYVIIKTIWKENHNTELKQKKNMFLISTKPLSRIMNAVSRLLWYSSACSNTFISCARIYHRLVLLSYILCLVSRLLFYTIFITIVDNVFCLSCCTTYDCGRFSWFCFETVDID